MSDLACDSGLNRDDPSLRRSLDGMNIDDLPAAEFAFPGPLRDRLVAAILSGAKTSTSGLVLGYERGSEPLPEAGQLSAVVDSAGKRVAVIELTDVRVVRLADVDLQHVVDEGEGDESVPQWRAGTKSSGTAPRSARSSAILPSPWTMTPWSWPSASGW